MLKKSLTLVKWLLLLLAVAGIALYLVLSASLPNLDGKLETKGIGAPVSLERDSLGAAVIFADSREDAAFGLGFAHGQDRFFQMDLLRRNAAGELAELFGDGALKLDERNRFHQFRARAKAILATLPERDRAVLDAYARGVNSALDRQNVRGFEYLLTRSAPLPWQSEDSLLAIFSMYLDLQNATFRRELVLEAIKQQFGSEMLAFVSQNDPLQAALDASLLPTPTLQAPAFAPMAVAANAIGDEPIKGSNNWAVSGELTQSGHAMLSDDMHLGLAVPIIWYRAQLNYPHAGKPQRITGVSLPGAPVIVVGSNGHIAWGFTNGYTDTADWVKLEKDEAVQTQTERLESSGEGKDMPLKLSRFGPVKSLGNQDYALSWVAHSPYAVNLSLMALETAKSVDEGLQLTQSAGIPAQNMLIVDASGNAAWRLTGALPSRSNPSETAISADNWHSGGWRSPMTDVPLVKNPSNHRLWSANSRVLSASDNPRFGNGGYAIGSRAVQIRDNLLAKDNFTEQDFLAMQLDNRALFMSRWQTLLLGSLKQAPDEFADDIKALENWGACACADSVGYSLVHSFREALLDTLFAPLQTELAKQDLSLSTIKGPLEVAAWQLLEQQPAAWLPAGNADWQALLVNVYLGSRTKLLAEHGKGDDISTLNWGKVNALKVQHPFSKQMPFLSPLLDMPVVAGFGGKHEPAVQTAAFGASQRFVVQPGREQDGILMLPGGQSEHPLSPFYRLGFDDYANHTPTPLLPGKAVHKLELMPQ
ncbi:penicillin acylase family protein [Shewanella sp. JM162201]|uniref:Penicillin acylase family protein n=1 Tax=Shewanella jiangmenensis TaxID=2837387 RepID=A0ABS5V5L7_9GAMM|nr:penicillin acylase family protein [Shewanella jiangmenensis]MBT1445145.1 penicillin acylase family protein [Shewanella jiangmenensis]